MELGPRIVNSDLPLFLPCLHLAIISISFIPTTIYVRQSLSRWHGDGLLLSSFYDSSAVVMPLLGPQMSSSHAAEWVKFPSGEILQREVGSEEGGRGIQSDIAPSHPISMACLAARRKQFDWGGDKRQEMVSFCSRELLTRNSVCREVWSVSVRIIWHEQGKPFNFVASVFKTIVKTKTRIIEIDFLQSKADLYDPNAFFAK